MKKSDIQKDISKKFKAGANYQTIGLQIHQLKTKKSAALLIQLKKLKNNSV